MSRRDEINRILKNVEAWTSEDRVALAYQILRDMRNKTREDAPRKTLDRALGVAKGTSPPPDDAIVKKWIEEHRLRKYG
jgi:hypothetical protein